MDVTCAVEASFELDDDDRAMITYLFSKLGPNPAQVGRKILIAVTRGMSDVGEPCMTIEVVYNPRDKQ